MLEHGPNFMLEHDRVHHYQRGFEHMAQTYRRTSALELLSYIVN